MPSWLLPPQILLIAAPLAMILAALALSAGERRAKARRAREALGEPLRKVDGASAGDVVVVEGTLHVLEDPCVRFEDGAPAAVTTVESRRAPLHPIARLRTEVTSPRVACSARAGALVLSRGKEHVLLDGPMEVSVGSEEMEPGTRLGALTAKVRERVETAAGGPSELATDESLPPPLFRSVRDGARVRVRGRLAKTSEGTRAGYRESARWTIVGNDDAPAVIAYDGTPHHRGSASAVWRGVRRIDLRQVALAATIVVAGLGALAYAIGTRAHRRAQGADGHVGVSLAPHGLARQIADDDRRMRASCVKPRPTALPDGWRCVGEAESFTMYLPEAVWCAEPSGGSCFAKGFEGAGMHIHPHYDAEEIALETVEHRGTEVEIDGVPARVLRSHGTITLLFEEDGTGVPPRLAPQLRAPRLAFDVTCDTDEACRNAWLALQTLRLW